METEKHPKKSKKKKTLLIILICFVGLASLGGILALFFGNLPKDWEDSKDYPGLRFYSLETARLDRLNFSALAEGYAGGKDAYVCVIEEGCPSELTVPSEFNGKPVIGVTGLNLKKTATGVFSLTLGDGIEYVESLCYNCTGLTEVVIPASVKVVRDSFRNCESIEKVTFLGDIERLESSFKYSGVDVVAFRGSVSVFTDSFGYSTPLVLLYPGASLPEENFMKDGVKFAHVTDTLYEFAGGFDASLLEAKAASHIQEELPEDKRIEPEQAGEYALVLNGPVVGTARCPNCKPGEYLTYKTVVGEDWTPGLETVSVTDIEYDWPGTVYTDDKAAAVLGGSAPRVYAFAEMIGCGDYVTYAHEQGWTYGSYCHIFYRISLRNADTDELIAWFEFESGYAPGRFTEGSTVASELYVLYGALLEEDGSEPTPLRSVMRSVYGK